MNSRKTIVRNPGNANNVKFPCFIFSVCQSLILQPHGFNKLKYRENYSHSVFLYATSVTCLIMCYLLKKNNKNNRYKCKTCNSLVHRKCTNLNTLEIFEIKHSKSKNWEHIQQRVPKPPILLRPLPTTLFKFYPTPLLKLHLHLHYSFCCLVSLMKSTHVKPY